MSVRPLAAIGIGAGAALLAALVAIAINTGILRAAGPVQGPGRLGAVVAPSAAEGKPGPASTAADRSQAREPSGGRAGNSAPSSGGGKTRSTPSGSPMAPEHEFGAGNDD